MSEHNYFDYLVAIDEYAQTGNTDSLRECLDSGRPVTKAIRILIGDALIARIQGTVGRGRGRQRTPWADNPAFARAIAAAYDKALIEAAKRPPRDRRLKTGMSDSAWAAEFVAYEAEPFCRLKMTPNSVLRACTAAKVKRK